MTRNWIYLYQIRGQEFRVGLFFSWPTSWFAHYTCIPSDLNDVEVNTMHFSAICYDQVARRCRK